METKVKENGQAVNTVKADRTPKFVAGNPVNAVSEKTEQGKEKAEPADTSGAENAEGTDQVNGGVKTEVSKKEIKFQLSEEKPALNLEQTLKKIKELGRLSHQRDKLIVTIDELDGFEIKQEDEAEETSLNHFQRCELRITDDNGESFSTKNPFIIDTVAKNIKALCVEKLAEVEGNISLNL